MYEWTGRSTSRTSRQERKGNWISSKLSLILTGAQTKKLSTLRYGEEPYGSATSTTLQTLDPVHHKGTRLALGAFAICKTENILTHRKTAIRILTNETHPTRHYFINKTTQDEYASKPKTLKPFIRVTQYFVNLDIYVRKIEKTLSYRRPTVERKPIFRTKKRSRTKKVNF
jgi:hypothetical protein